jgi:ABC-type glycerol-3-phosphate transport system substrate-binding protein
MVLIPVLALSGIVFWWIWGSRSLQNAELVLTFPMPYRSGFEAMYASIQAEFQFQHPKTRVKLDPVGKVSGWEEENSSGVISEGFLAGYWNTIALRMLTRRDLDLIWIPEDPVVLSRKGVLLDLKPVLTGGKLLHPSEFDQGAWAAYTDRRDYPAVPLGLMIVSTKINRRICGQLNLQLNSETWTWEQVLALSKDIFQSSGGKKLGVFPSGRLFQIYLEATCPGWYDPQTTQVKLNTPQFRHAVEYFQGLKNAYNWDDITLQTYLGTGDDTVSDAKFQGEISCLDISRSNLIYNALTGTWSNSAGPLPFTPQILSAPRSETTGSCFKTGADLLGIFRGSRRPKEAMDLLAMLLSPPAQKKYYYSFSRMPINRTVRTELKTFFLGNASHWSKLPFRALSSSLDAIDQLYDQSRMVQNVPRAKWIWAQIIPILPFLINGTASLDETLPNLELKINLALQQM